MTTTPQSPQAAASFDADAPAFDPFDLNSVCEFLLSTGPAPAAPRPAARPRAARSSGAHVVAREGIARDRVRSAVRKGA